MPRRTVAGTFTTTGGALLASTLTTWRPTRGRWQPHDRYDPEYTTTTDAWGRYCLTLHAPARYQVTATGLTPQTIDVEAGPRSPTCHFGAFLTPGGHVYRIRDACQVLDIDLFSTTAFRADNPLAVGLHIDACLDAGLKWQCRLRCNNDGATGLTLAPTDAAGRAAVIAGWDTILNRTTPGGLRWGDCVEFLSIENEANLDSHYEIPVGGTITEYYGQLLADACAHYGADYVIADSGCSQAPLYDLLMRAYRADGDDASALRLAAGLYLYGVDGWTGGPFPDVASIDVALVATLAKDTRTSEYLALLSDYVDIVLFHSYYALHTVGADNKTEACWALGEMLDRVIMPYVGNCAWGTNEYGIWEQTDPPYAGTNGHPDDVCGIPATIDNTPALLLADRGAAYAVFYSVDVPLPDRARSLTADATDVITLRDTGERWKHVRDTAGSV